MRSKGNATRKFGHVGVQLTLRDQVSLDPTELLKAAMHEALKRSPLSRAQVVEDMNRLAGASGLNGKGPKITESMLDKWVARGSAHIIPIKYLRIFCLVTQSFEPIAALLPPGPEIIGPEDRALLIWARTETERRRLSRQARRLAQEAGIE